MRLRPPALQRPCDFGRPPGPPDLRPARSAPCRIWASSGG